VLFLAGIFGERPKSGKEVILATQRALEQQALERWRLQQEAQIAAMLRRGEPLGAVAAALASPETAERIAVLGRLQAAASQHGDAARLNVRRVGHDLALLDGLSGPGSRSNGEEAAAPASPLSHPLQMPQLAPLATANGARS
jgi:hypothetical protein